MHGMKYFESSHLIFACASVDGHCTGHAAGMKGTQAVAVRQAVEVRKAVAVRQAVEVRKAVAVRKAATGA